jgi:ABC-type branched-subunit amino acid transport system substrate-binding protein
MMKRAKVIVFTGFYCVFISNTVLNASDSSQHTPSAMTAVELGKRIYQQGILSDGVAITAVTQDDISLSGIRVICADCHRRSGFGSSEGGTSVPAVTGSVLYEPRTELRRELYGRRSAGPGSRPGYTDELLGQALRKGVDPSGRKLDKLMPRYNISNNELNNLITYLKSIDSTPAPGVSESTIHFATIVTPGVANEQKQAMLETLGRYINDLNAGTRNETKRAKFSPWHKTWHYGSYRKWQLHIWELEGTPDCWQTQLNEFYTRQPVFAVINGIGMGEWRPIHEFCNAIALPCIFPTTDLPVTSEEDFYTIYFSRGISLEAETIAKLLSQLTKPISVVQIHANTQEAITAANSTKHQLLKRGISDITSFDIATLMGNDDRHLKAVIDVEKPMQLILWLDHSGISNIEPSLNKYKNIEQVFVSDTLLENDITAVPDRLLDKTYVIRQYSTPDKLPEHLSRAKSWATARKLTISDDYAMANAYFAATITADVIKHLRANLIRDYFIERIEHMVENTVFHSVYPRLSLGPGQRFASKGCYIAGPLLNGTDGLLAAKYNWVVP